MARAAQAVLRFRVGLIRRAGARRIRPHGPSIKGLPSSPYSAMNQSSVFHVQLPKTVGLNPPIRSLAA